MTTKETTQQALTRRFSLMVSIGRAKFQFTRAADELIANREGKPDFEKQYQGLVLSTIGSLLLENNDVLGLLSALNDDLMGYQTVLHPEVTPAQMQQLGEMSREVRERMADTVLGKGPTDEGVYLETLNQTLYRVIADYPLLSGTALAQWMYDLNGVFSRKVGIKNPSPHTAGLRYLAVKPKLDVLFEQFIVRQIYQYLVEKAFQGETTTYSEIAISFGLPASGNQLGAALSPILSKIFVFCANGGQPHLTSLVVRKSGDDKGLPGGGFWDLLRGHSDLDVPPQRQARREVTADLQNEVFSYWSKLGL